MRKPQPERGIIQTTRLALPQARPPMSLTTQGLRSCTMPRRRCFRRAAGRLPISTARQIVLYGIALIPVSLVPGMLGMTGRIYFIGALILGLVYLYSGVRVALERTLVRARAVLLTSVLYLPLIYGLMLLDRPGL